MRAEKRILTNTAVLGVGEAVGQIATFAFVILCGRAFGTTVLGWYSMGMAVGAIAAVLASLGTHTLLLRELAQRPELSTRHIGGALPYQTGLSALVLAAVAVSLLLFVEDGTGRWIVAALCVYHLALATTSLLLIPLRARQILWPSALAGAALRVTVVIAAFALVTLGFSTEPVFAAFAVAAVVVAVIALAATKRVLGARLGRMISTLPEQRALYARSMPFFGAAVLDVLYSRLGLLLITVIAGAESAGVYTAADRLLVTVSMFRMLFIGALYPALAQLVATDRVRALELSNRSMRLIVVLTIPAAGVLAIFHRDIMALMFGPGFEESGLLLLLLTPLLVVRGVNAVWTTQANAAGLQRAVVRARATMVAVFAVTAVVLIMVAGPIGLAIALLLAECLYAAAVRAPLARDGFAAGALQLLVKPLLAVAAGALAYIAASGAALPLQALAVVAAIGVASFATGAVRLHDVRDLQSVLTHK